MPTVTIHSPLTGDVVGTSFGVFVVFDVTAIAAPPINAVGGYVLKCSVNGVIQQSAIGLAETSGSRSFSYAGVAVGTAGITCQLFADTDLIHPLAQDSESVTVQGGGNPPGVIIGGAFLSFSDAPKAAASLLVTSGQYRTDIGVSDLVAYVQRIDATHQTMHGNPTTVKTKTSVNVKKISLAWGAGVWAGFVPPGLQHKHFVFRITAYDASDSQLATVSDAVDD